MSVVTLRDLAVELPDGYVVSTRSPVIRDFLEEYERLHLRKEKVPAALWESWLTATQNFLEKAYRNWEYAAEAYGAYLRWRHSQSTAGNVKKRTFALDGEEWVLEVESRHFSTHMPIWSVRVYNPTGSLVVEDFFDRQLYPRVLPIRCARGVSRLVYCGSLSVWKCIDLRGVPCLREELVQMDDPRFQIDWDTMSVSPSGRLLAGAEPQFASGLIHMMSVTDADVWPPPIVQSLCPEVKRLEWQVNCQGDELLTISGVGHAVPDYPDE